MSLTDVLFMPITPGEGSAGIKLGDTPNSVHQLLGEPTKEDEIPSGIVKANYGVICVWFSDDTVIQIGVFKGYKGKTQDGIGIGTSRKELNEKWGLDLAYHDDDEYWEYISKPGTLFEFEKDAGGEEVISALYISAT